MSRSGSTTRVAEVDGLQVIIVTRFDRVGGGTLRIHQEDTSQALGVPPGEKYERFSGPGIADLRQLAANATGSAASKNVDRLRDMLNYHWLIVNNDAHGKNYSWLFAPDGSPELSPLYDACSWLLYRANRQGRRIPLAMRMGEGFNFKTCDKQAGLVGLADKLRRSLAEVCGRAVELASGLPAALDSTVRTLPGIAANPHLIERHVEDLCERAQSCERLAEHKLQSSRRTSTVRDADETLAAHTVETRRASGTRCAHVGKASKMRCIRPVHQDKNHRYT